MNKFSFNPSIVNNDKPAQADNGIALKKCEQLFNNGYYFIVQPKSNQMGEPYFWITATKRSEDREQFPLKVNEPIVNYVVSRMANLKSEDISTIDANDLETFAKSNENFELSLYSAERALGKTMQRTYTQRTLRVSSYYKNGVIVYEPNLNPALKELITA